MLFLGWRIATTTHKISEIMIYNVNTKEAIYRVMASCRIFFTIKILVVLLLADLTSSTKISNLTKITFSKSI